jgi:translation initiation factor IF-3
MSSIGVVIHLSREDLMHRYNKLELKEIRLSPHTDEHDFNFKVNNSIRFLKDKNKSSVIIIPSV